MPFYSQNFPFLYSAKPNVNPKNNNTAFILLPDIYIFNEPNLQLLDFFANEFGFQSFGLDYFYELNQEKNGFSYENGMNQAVSLMKQMSGNSFVDFFTKATDAITTINPNITEFIVCGFCFGGGLALLSGVDPRVKRIVSFYGTSAHKPNFYDDKSIIEALVESRFQDQSLQILGFFGELDSSISEADRDLTALDLNEAEIGGYIEKIYQGVGHAYFAKQRESYSKIAYIESLEEVRKFLK